eukprot:m.73620 g.73620  ORF g.73620 m.73620 type:complete len:230 (+) comp16127_c0_seq1:287-976(+)
MPNAHWLPLESNPDVINKFLKDIGVRGDYQFFDIFGTDPDLLVMVPSPCIAVMLLFPISQAHETHSAEENARIQKEGQVVSPSVYFMKQTIGNACGTIGLIHAIANNRDKVELVDGFLKSFLDSSSEKSADERCTDLEESKGMTAAHEESAKEGQTAAPSIEDSVNLHFICLTAKDGHLYEFDGRKEFPINHGETTDATFLTDATKVCKDFMVRNPDSMEFNMVALAKA